MSDFDLEADEGPDDPNAVIQCWCGESGTAAELFDRAVFASGPCGGLGVLYCYCGGDQCVCHHHGTVDCPGCVDCQSEDQWDDDDYDD